MRYALVFLLVFVPLVSWAQSSTLDVGLSVTPDNPAPGSTFVVQAQSFSTDINLATFEWQYNGRIVAKGIGKTTLSLVAPNAGEVGVVQTTISGVGFDPTTTSIIVRPGSIDVIWEAVDAYTPPFYKGKALLPTGGMVRAVAIPAANAPKGLSYSWERNGSALDTQSGYNKTSVVFRNDILKTTEKVAVSALGGLFSGAGATAVQTTNPRIVLYENKNGFLNYANGAVNSYTIEQKNTVLHFEPYFFSKQNSAPGALFSFKQNTDEIPKSGVGGNELSVTSPGSGQKGELSVGATTAQYSLQNAATLFTLYFK